MMKFVLVSGEETSSISDITPALDRTLSCLEIKFDADEMENLEGNNPPLPPEFKVPKKERKQDTGNSNSTESKT